MDMEIHSWEGLGYRPLIDFESWRVAVLNYNAAKYTPQTAGDMERHLETDEVFALLSGSCTLLTAGAGKHPNQISAASMESGKLYNVKKGVWHALIGSEDMKLLIVENANTTRENSEHEQVDKELLTWVLNR